MGHSLGWYAVAEGEVIVDLPSLAGEMAVLNRSDQAIEFVAGGQADAVFVLGTAEPHPHPLHVGRYSIHTSASSLAAGEQHIEALRLKLIERERTRPALSNGSIPVMR